MNENLDVRMSNYLAILSNPNIQKNFDSNTVLAMQEALAIYTATTAVKYVQDYKEKSKASPRTTTRTTTRTKSRKRS